MFSQMWQRLKPPVFEDTYNTYIANILNVILLTLVVGIITLIGFAIPSNHLIFLVSYFLGILIALVLLHKKRLYTASLFFLGLSWCVITSFSLFYAGVNTPSFSAFVVLITLAGVFVGTRGALVVTLMSIGVGAISVFLEMEGIISPQEIFIHPMVIWITHAILFFLANAINAITTHAIRDSFTHLQQKEVALTEHNLKLEQEIIERQQTEQTLRHSQQKYRLLFEHAGIPAVLFEQDFTILMINPAAARLLGGRPEQFNNRLFKDILHPDIEERIFSVLQAVWETGKGKVFEEVYQSRRGMTRYFLVDVQRVDDIDGKPVCVQVLAPEITEQKLAETRNLELALAKEKTAFLTDFLSTMSHDIKTPLSIINTSLHLLKQLHTPERQQERILQIQEQTDLVEKYLQDVLMVSQLEYLPKVTPQTIALNEMVLRIIERFRPKIEKKALELDLQLVGDLPLIQVDREQFNRAITNLIENAVNYTPTGGSIMVRTRRDAQDKVCLEISDSGIGIGADDIPMIFERFYRANQAREVENQGTGLGLAIVKKIIDMHQHQIHVQSALGQGTRFSIDIPLTPRFDAPPESIPSDAAS